MNKALIRNLDLEEKIRLGIISGPALEAIDEQAHDIDWHKEQAERWEIDHDALSEQLDELQQEADELTQHAVDILTDVLSYSEDEPELAADLLGAEMLERVNGFLTKAVNHHTIDVS